MLEILHLLREFFPRPHAVAIDHENLTGVCDRHGREFVRRLIHISDKNRAVADFSLHHEAFNSRSCLAYIIGVKSHAPISVGNTRQITAVAIADHKANVIPVGDQIFCRDFRVGKTIGPV